MNGKGIFLWWAPTVGDHAFLAQALKDGKFERLEIKVADGSVAYAPTTHTPNLIQALRATNPTMRIYGWSFNYGYDPVTEAKMLVRRCRELDLDGAIVDVEGKFYGQPDPVGRADTLMRTIRSEGWSKPLGACTWALFRNPVTFSQWHDPNVAKALMGWADFGMPMAYQVPLNGVGIPLPWNGASAASWWADNTIRQWRLITNKPLVLAGRAYDGDGTTATVGGLTEFSRECRVHADMDNVTGESYWHLAGCIRSTGIPTQDKGVWPAMRGLEPWGAQVPEVPTECCAGLDEIRELAEAARDLLDAILDRTGTSEGEP